MPDRGLFSFFLLRSASVTAYAAQKHKVSIYAHICLPTGA
jgi:hypothetical protein